MHVSVNRCFLFFSGWEGRANGTCGATFISHPQDGVSVSGYCVFEYEEQLSYVADVPQMVKVWTVCDLSRFHHLTRPKYSLDLFM